MISISKITNYAKRIFNPSVKPYILKIKTPKLHIESFKRDSHWQVPENADSFTIVEISKRADSSFNKKIISFFSGENLLKRCTDINGKPFEQKTFKQNTYGQGFDMVCNNKTIETYRYNGDINTPTLTEYEIQKSVKLNKDKLTRVQIQKNIFDKNNITGIIKECLPQKIRNKNGNKLLTIYMKMIEDIPYPIQEIANIAKFPKQKNITPFLFLFEPKTKIKSLTNYFLSRKNLDNMGIKIKFSDKIKRETNGYFAPQERSIYYNSTCCFNPIETCAHEVEHCYQYAQIGRLGKGYHKYEKDCYKKFGEIKDIEEMNEANKYYIASENYPKDIDLQETEYKNNYLEVKAREAAEKAYDEFSHDDIFIKNQMFFGF